MAALAVRRGRGGLALAALLLVATSCGGDGDGAGATTTTTEPAPTTTTIPDGPPEGTPASLDAVLDGQCLNHVPSPTQRNVATLVVGCDRPHIYEVYLTFRYPPGGDRAPAGAPYPGETTVRTTSEQHCYEQFEAWMGTPWTASEFDIQVWWPSEEGWVLGGDRKVLCGAYLLTGKLTVGSARGTAR